MIQNKIDLRNAADQFGSGAQLFVPDAKVESETEFGKKFNAGKKFRSQTKFRIAFALQISPNAFHQRMAASFSKSARTHPPFSSGALATTPFIRGSAFAKSEIQSASARLCTGSQPLSTKIILHTPAPALAAAKSSGRNARFKAGSPSSHA